MNKAISSPISAESTSFATKYKYAFAPFTSAYFFNKFIIYNILFFGTLFFSKKVFLVGIIASLVSNGFGKSRFLRSIKGLPEGEVLLDPPTRIKLYCVLSVAFSCLLLFVSWYAYSKSDPFFKSASVQLLIELVALSRVNVSWWNKENDRKRKSGKEYISSMSLNSNFIAKTDAEFKDLLEKKTSKDVIIQHTFGYSLAKKDPEILQMLIRNGLDLCSEDDGKSKMIQLIVDGSDLNMTKAAIEGTNYDVNRRYSKDMPILIAAVLSKNSEILKYILSKGAGIEMITGTTALGFAVANGWTAGVQILLESGANPNLTKFTSDSCLQCSISSKTKEISKLLFEAGAAIDDIPLSVLAVEFGDVLPTLKKLLEFQNRINSGNELQTTVEMSGFTNPYAGQKSCMFGNVIHKQATGHVVNWREIMKASVKSFDFEKGEHDSALVSEHTGDLIDEALEMESQEGDPTFGIEFAGDKAYKVKIHNGVVWASGDTAMIAMFHQPNADEVLTDKDHPGYSMILAFGRLDDVNGFSRMYLRRCTNLAHHDFERSELDELMKEIAVEEGFSEDQLTGMADALRSSPVGFRSIGAGRSGEDPYSILGISSTATAEMIKAKYRELARANHSDKTSKMEVNAQKAAEKRMRQVNEAYRILSKRRAA